MQLSNRLRTEGIGCNIDQYETSPHEGWPRWMTNQIEEADFVLVVCTEKYEKRYKGKEEAGTGLGAKWEGAIITQELYDSVANNKFIPIAFSSNDSLYIPVILKSATYYELTTEEVYDELYARLTSQTLVPKPPIGELRQLTPRSLHPFESTSSEKLDSTEDKQKPDIGEIRELHQNVSEENKNSVSSCEIICANCRNWFRSFIQFGDTETFKDAILYYNTEMCPYCKTEVPSNKKIMRFVERD